MGSRVKGPSTQYLGTWDLGNSNFSAGFGEVYNYQVLGPLGPSNVVPFWVCYFCW